MTQEFLQYAGQVIIDTIILYSSDRKKSLDISLLFNEIDLFEDLYSSVMHGSISMIDGFNLPSVFPILGEEVLEFTCHTPTSNAVITKQFAIIALNDKTITTNKTQVYALKFVSIESLIDMNIRVYKAFAGTPSDSVIQLFKTYFPNKKLVVEKSSNAIKLVAPSISPFNFINLLASKAYSTVGHNEPTFLFYEDNQSYNFVSLASLFSNAPKITYRWSQSQLRIQDSTGESVRDIQAEYENVKEMYIDSSFDTINKTMSGALGHKVFEVDIIRKTINKKTYSYLDDFSKTSHLNKFPTNSDNMIHSNNAVLETCIIHPAYHSNFTQDRDADILVRRPSILAEMEFIKLDIVVNGRTDLKVGDVVSFEMGTFSTNDETDKNKENRIDQYYSGNYIIAAIQHRFTLTRHESIMQIVKDSFPNKITL